MIRNYRDSLSTLQKTYKNKCCISYDLDLSRKWSRTISRVVFDITIRFVTIDNLFGVCKRGCEVFTNRRIIVSNLFCEYLCTSFLVKYLTNVPHFYQKALTDWAENFFSSIWNNLEGLFFVSLLGRSLRKENSNTKSTLKNACFLIGFNFVKSAKT